MTQDRWHNLRKEIELGNQPYKDEVDQATWKFCYDAASSPDCIAELLAEYDALRRILFKFTERSYHFRYTQELPAVAKKFAHRPFVRRPNYKNSTDTPED